MKNETQPTSNATFLGQGVGGREQSSNLQLKQLQVQHHTPEKMFYNKQGL